VPREKLIKHFGHSGLGIYERLEVEQFGCPKLIEADPVEQDPTGAITSVRHCAIDEDEPEGD